MKRKVLVLLAGILFIAGNLYAAGDLIVDGNLGVGTTSPQSRLHVKNGDIQLSGSNQLSPSLNLTGKDTTGNEQTGNLYFDADNKRYFIGGGDIGLNNGQYLLWGTFSSSILGSGIGGGTMTISAGNLTLDADVLNVNGAFQLGATSTVSSGLLHGTVSVNPPSIAAGASATLTVTISGAAAGDRIFLTPPSTINGNLFYQGATVTAANTVTIRIGNESTAAVDDTAKTWSYLLIKP